MENGNQEIVVSKLNTIIKLLALNIGEGKNQIDRIRMLSAAGLTPKEIAKAIGTTPNTVSVGLATIRKRSKNKSNRKGGAEDD